MEKFFDILWKVSGTLAWAVAYGIKWYDKNKEGIETLVFVVEKKSKGKLTNDEKINMLIELFYEKLYPRLPAWAKLIPKRIIETHVRKIVYKFIKKAKTFKDKGENK